MAEISTKAWQCDVCEYIWLKVAGRTPKHCASKACRSRKWNSGAVVRVKSGSAARQTGQSAGADKVYASTPVLQVSNPASPTKLPPAHKPKVADVRFTPQPPQERPSGPTKAKIDSLRSMIAGIESRAPEMVTSLGHGPEPEPAADVTPVCKSEFCGKPLRGVENRLGIRWACDDRACPMFGQEQKQ